MTRNMDDDLAELETVARSMENLGAGDLELASGLLSRAAALHTRLQAPLAALERLSATLAKPESRPENFRQDS